VIVPHIPGLFLNDYYNEVLAGVSDALIESEYQFKLVLLKPNGNNWDLHNFKIGQGIDGLIVANWPQFFSDKSIFKRLNLASAIINDNDSNLNTHRVSCDNEAGGRLAAETFFRKGHRFCAVLTGPKWSLDSQQRLKGFKEICKQKGMSLPLELIVSANYNEHEAAEKMKALVRSKKKFTALFCLNDAMAIGAMHALKQMGLRCPKDVSVIGFDNEKRSAYQESPLTTLHHPIYEIAKGATQILAGDLDRKKSKRKQFVEQVFPVHLVERKSVATI